MKQINYHKYTVLIVEDDSITLENYALVLENMFETVYRAEDGEKAYNLYQKYSPSIMLIDIDIPKLNGLQLLEKIRKEDHNTKAILFTSYSDKETLLKASKLKLTQYLIKPIKNKELFEALELSIKELKTLLLSQIK